MSQVPSLRTRPARPSGLRRGGRRRTCLRVHKSASVSGCNVQQGEWSDENVPEIFQPGSSLSSSSALPSGMPQTTSDLTVRSESTGGAPDSVARLPIAIGKGVEGGTWQSKVSWKHERRDELHPQQTEILDRARFTLRWLRSPLKTTRSDSERCRNRSGAARARAFSDAIGFSRGQPKECALTLLLERPEGVARDPEGVVLVDPLALLDVLLPPSTHLAERGDLLVRVVREDCTRGRDQLGARRTREDKGIIRDVRWP